MDYDGNRSGKPKAPKGVCLVVHVREGSRLHKSEKDRGHEKRLHSGCILKTDFVGWLTRCEKI